MEVSNQLNYKNLFFSISTPVIVTDHLLDIMFFNDPLLELLEIDKSKITGRRLTHFFHLSDMEKDKLKSQLTELETYELIKESKENPSQQFRLKFKSMERPMESNVLYFVEIQYYSQKTLSQEDILKMGKKTGQLAHSISNPLSVIRIHCDNFSLKAKKVPQFPSGEVLERVQKLAHATDRLSEYTNELKNMAKLLTDNDLEAILNFFAEEKKDRDPVGH